MNLNEISNYIYASKLQKEMKKKERVDPRSWTEVEYITISTGPPSRRRAAGVCVKGILYVLFGKLKHNTNDVYSFDLGFTNFLFCSIFFFLTFFN